MRILDLCSGLGGASEAFLRAGHDVLRIENNHLLAGVPHTHIMDVFEFEKWMLKAMKTELGAAVWVPDLIWASPPCTEFSFANPKRPDNPSTSIARCCLRIIMLLKPRWWVIENVRGAVDHFAGFLGPPAQVINKFHLWGRFPTIKTPDGWSHRLNVNKHSSKDPLRSNKRGLIPLEISSALMEGCFEQATLDEFTEVEF